MPLLISRCLTCITEAERRVSALETLVSILAQQVQLERRHLERTKAGLFAAVRDGDEPAAVAAAGGSLDMLER